MACQVLGVINCFTNIREKAKHK